MLDLRVLSVKKLWAVVTVGAVLLTASCKKEDAGKLPEVPRGNPQQVILTVNGISVTEDQTDGKLGAYLLYNPYADEEQIRGARKSIAHSIAESILIDEMLKKQGLAPDEKEIEQAGRYLEFFYKDTGWVKKNAEYKNISEEEMYRDNLLEYKKMKLLAAQKDTDKPSAEELNRFLSENRELYAEKPERKTTYQILVRYGNGNSSSSEKAKKTADKARDELREGKDFRSVARKYSDLDPDESAAFLGALWEECPYYGDRVAEMVWALNPGESSDVYDGEFGSYSVFYVKELLPEEELTEEEWKQWGELLLILQKNEIRYHLLFEDVFKDSDIVYSLEYDAVPEV